MLYVIPCGYVYSHFGINVQDDETTLSEEEELAKADSNNHIDEVRKCYISVKHIRSLCVYRLVNSFPTFAFTCSLVPLNEAAIFQIALLQKESEIPVEELLARYRKVCCRIDCACL